MTNWKNRIIKTGSEDPNQLLANEWNWRIHPREQQDAIEAALDEVGWIQYIVINLRSSELWGQDRNVATVLNGHARVKIALRRNQETVPVMYVDLTPVEEKKMLIALDRTTNMAVEDSAMLLDLINSLENEGEIPTVDENVKILLESRTLDYEPPIDELWQGMPEFEQEDLSAFRAIKVNFSQQEDVDNFSELIGQQFTDKTKSIWYPEQERDRVANLRYSSES